MANEPTKPINGHTPGPWHVGLIANVFDRDDVMIADVWGRGIGDGVELEANARLIAAAPQMLSALKYALGQLRDWWPPGFHKLTGTIEYLEKTIDAATKD